MSILGKVKVLLVEDDPFLQSMYMTKFELEGFEVYSANDGELGAALALEKIPDIILLDILMPKMDGFEVLQHLKADKKTSNIPVIMLTNLNQKEEVEKCLVLGADDYLIKAHFMPTEVVARIIKLLNSKK